MNASRILWVVVPCLAVIVGCNEGGFVAGIGGDNKVGAGGYGGGGSVPGGGGSGGEHACGENKYCPGAGGSDANGCSPRNNPDTGCAADGCKPCFGVNDHVASSACTADGACQLTKCETGFWDADGNSENGCEAACPTGRADCDGDSSNQCEEKVDDDKPEHSCAAHLCEPCYDAGHHIAVPVCESDGSCGFTACETGFLDCDANAANGCETDVRPELPANPDTGCAARGCAPCFSSDKHVAEAECAVDGSCAIVNCEEGYANCDGLAGNGCEEHVGDNTPEHGCSNKTCLSCYPPEHHVVAACSPSGACEVVACDDGFGDCDRVPSNGCEINIATSLTNCGACGYACLRSPFVNSGWACISGVCQCDDDTDCRINGMQATTGAATVSRRCGGASGLTIAGVTLPPGTCGCGSPDGSHAVACHSGEYCKWSGAPNTSYSICSCAGGPPCDASETCCDGCKKLDTDQDNCGRCGYVCAAGKTCVAGICTSD